MFIHISENVCVLNCIIYATCTFKQAVISFFVTVLFSDNTLTQTHTDKRTNTHRQAHKYSLTHTHTYIRSHVLNRICQLH